MARTRLEVQNQKLAAAKAAAKVAAVKVEAKVKAKAKLPQMSPKTIATLMLQKLALLHRCQIAKAIKRQLQQPQPPRVRAGRVPPRNRGKVGKENRNPVST